MTRRLRGRELGLPFPGTPGTFNALTDVQGVEVGFTTLITSGAAPARTGVTAILPRGRAASLEPVWAGHHRFNGNGELTGLHWVEDAGYFRGPICLTNTHSVGIVHHGVTRWMIEQHADTFRERHLWLMPVVGETYDGVLSDINAQHVTEAHVRAALDGAVSGPVAEGNVGGGTGMIAYGFKGGTGTSSRVLNIAGTSGCVAALVQANFGIRPWLHVLGVPVGRHLDAPSALEREQGSVIVVIGTDFPMLPHQLRRLARRATLGIGRTGTAGGNSSGDLFLAFSVANRRSAERESAVIDALEFVNDDVFDPIYEAACEAVEEAVVNALLAARTMTAIKPRGWVVEAIDPEQLLEVMRRYGRL
ncbi:P1 family peptidase [Deinococcus yavapaiensis]|uniref:L-aminopeptidase DmpA n=1 Tax=Deinococcus yavapaiensis KR-236 TaxID=694435 RepID=A0A318S876_9DEIO|nr:P1 family peptidase [Deinococcus yavapaiensis]PYE53938.1 L-aminopeptidase DmpA [Deinococcus yavapaiensis KR-236]